MVNIGQMFRNGFTGDVKSPDAMPLLMMGCNARTSDASGAENAKMPQAPMKKEDARNADIEEPDFTSGLGPPFVENCCRSTRPTRCGPRAVLPSRSDAAESTKY
jgi:hypothetical protein